MTRTLSLTLIEEPRAGDIRLQRLEASADTGLTASVTFGFYERGVPVYELCTFDPDTDEEAVCAPKFVNLEQSLINMFAFFGVNA